MRRLILFRHAEAVHSSKYGDRDRPLTDAGRIDAARAGARLAELAPTIDLVLASNALRARETWEIAAARLPEAPETRLEKKLYEADRRDLMHLARQQPDSVKTLILVGHNPSIAEFAVHFAGQGEPQSLRRLAKGYPPGGLAVFDLETDEWRALRWGDGTLAHFPA